MSKSNDTHYAVGMMTFYAECTPSYFTGLATVERIIDHLADRAMESGTLCVRVFSGDGEDVVTMRVTNAGPEYVPISNARTTMKTEMLFRALWNKHDAFRKAVEWRKELRAKHK